MGKMIILNHKMTLEYDDVYSYIEGLNNIDTKYDIVVCPSYLYLESFVNNCYWGVGSQNVFYKNDGNYTGEVSVLQLKSLGVCYAMVGHYERRKYFHESDEDIKKKLNACLDANIIPILCFGESGVRNDIVAFLDKVLSGIDNINFIVFAYEPLKVVNSENVEDIRDNVDYIYSYLYDRYNVSPNIVYGGGIDTKNINELFSLSHLNGVLIGKVSSDISKVEKIIKKLDKKK